VRLTVRVSKEMRDALDAFATALDRDRGHVVNEWLTSHNETLQWQVEHIRRGLHEAEAGKFIPSAQAGKVIDRLRRG
jgi:predicted transcriptional regulator